VDRVDDGTREQPPPGGTQRHEHVLQHQPAAEDPDDRERRFGLVRGHQPEDLPRPGEQRRPHRGRHRRRSPNGPPPRPGAHQENAAR
jgi:hypothetical protein